MTARLLLSFVVSLAIGWFVVALLWPAGTRGPRAQRLVAAFLGFGVGHGVTSCVVFIYLLVHGRADSAYWLVELTLLACLLVVYWIANRRERGVSAPAPAVHPDVSAGRFATLLPIAYYTTAAMALTTVALRSWQAPHGGYDAWVIWNARARAIFRSGDAWRDNIWNAAIGHVQLDYPLMLPLSVLRAWMYAGAETTVAPALLAWLFTAATIGLLTAAVAALCGRLHGYVAGIILLGHLFFMLHANSQLAEAPLNLFYLGALVLIAFHNASQPATDRGTMIAAGLVAGLAAWTKNEGLLFLFALAVAHGGVVIYSAGLREYLRQVSALAAGLLPLAAVIVYFKIQFAAPNMLIAGLSTPHAADLIADLHRYLAIGRQIAKRLILYEGLGISMTYVLALLAVCFGMTRRHIVSVAQIAFVVTIMFCAFIGIYLVAVPGSGGTISAFIGGSIDRLLLQLWPAVVFAFFLLAKPLARS
jgi:hypothetical protein